MANQLIYGKQPVAEAERGRRRVHRVWRAPQTGAEELERLCGSPDHQGVVAEVDPYPYGLGRFRTTRCLVEIWAAPCPAGGADTSEVAAATSHPSSPNLFNSFSAS